MWSNHRHKFSQIEQTEDLSQRQKNEVRQSNDDFFHRRLKTLKKYNVDVGWLYPQPDIHVYLHAQGIKQPWLNLLGFFVNLKFLIDAKPVWDVVFWINRSHAAFELVEIGGEVRVKFLSTKCSEDKCNWSASLIYTCPLEDMTKLSWCQIHEYLDLYIYMYVAIRCWSLSGEHNGLPQLSPFDVGKNRSKLDWKK